MSKNYFKLLNLPEKLLIDHNELKKNYFNLLKECSLDPVLDKTGDKKTSKGKRDLLGEAYNTLKDRMLRIEHLLQIEGITVANDNKAPSQFAAIATKVSELTVKVKTDQSSRDELKRVHSDVITEFSTISMELTRLETAWDAREKNDPELLKRLKRKCVAFNYIRSVDKEIRFIMKNSATSGGE